MITPTTVPQTWPVIQPSLYETLMKLESEILAIMFCHEPGQIVSFNASTGLAVVQPTFKRTTNIGTIINRVPIPDVPIWTPGGGGAWLQFPIAAGDQCLLCYADRDIGAWYIQGGQGQPPTRRMHSESDAFALVGLSNQATPAPAWPTTMMRLLSSGGAELDLTNAGLVSIKNTTTSLLTLLNNLITVLTALQVQVGGSAYPLTAASITALNAYATTLSTLLV